MNNGKVWVCLRACIRPASIVERLGAGLVRVELRDSDGEPETRIVNEARIFATRKAAHAARDKGVRVA